MTENEALELMKSLQISKDCELVKTLDFKATVIKALEEIQQYRAIGTVEELKTMKENGAFTGVELAQLAAMQMRLKKYSTIGTIEEFKVLKEKSVAKKAEVNEFDYGEGYVCGECESFLHYVDDDDEHIRTNYCCHCGTKIDWQ